MTKHTFLVEAAGGKALPCVVDIRDEKQVQKAIDEAIKKVFFLIFIFIIIYIHNYFLIKKTKNEPL